MPEQPPINPSAHVSENVRAKTAGIDASGPKPGSELRLGQFSIWFIYYDDVVVFYFIAPYALRIMVKLLWLLPFAADAVPCRIAFERGKERQFFFLPISWGTSGWLVLAEELPLKQYCGVVRVAAPLAGSNVCTIIAVLLFLS